MYLCILKDNIFSFIIWVLYFLNTKFSTVNNRKNPQALFACILVNEDFRIWSPHNFFLHVSQQNTSKLSPQSNGESPTVQPMTPEPDVSEQFSYFFQVRSNDWQNVAVISIFLRTGEASQKSCCGTRQWGVSCIPVSFSTRQWDPGEVCELFPQFPLLELLVVHKLFCVAVVFWKMLEWGSLWRSLIAPSLTYIIWSEKDK